MNKIIWAATGFPFVVLQVKACKKHVKKGASSGRSFLPVFAKGFALASATTPIPAAARSK